MSASMTTAMSASDLPLVGLQYVITEWDETISVVRILRVTSTDVRMEYPEDGAQQEVSLPYFNLCLQPMVLQ